MTREQAINILGYDYMAVVSADIEEIDKDSYHVFLFTSLFTLWF